MALSFSVLKIRDFRFLMLTRALVTMALQSQAVIVGWQIYSITKNPFMLGLAGLFEAIPAILCALFSGHVVDNGKPHKIYTICLSVLMVNTFLLLIFAGGFAEIQSHYIVCIIYAGVFISGVARSFIMPSSFALLSQIVPREKMPAASAWLTSGFQTAAISGPAIAGIIYGGYGARDAWFMPVILIVMAFFMLMALSEHPKKYKSSEVREAAISSIAAGWRFIFRNRVLLSIMALDMFAVLFGGAVSMLPAFADQVLHVGSKGLGELRAAPALGSIIMALILAIKPMKNIKASWLFIAVSGFGLCIIGFGMSTVFWSAMLFLILSGIFDSISMVVRSSMMQLLTPNKMRGRVSSVNSMFVISSNEIGAFESGVAASVFGLVPSIIIGGCATLGVVITTYFISPKLRKTVINTDSQAK